MIPNTICPGAQKSGTTYLFNLLKQHPDIFVPIYKELHFFSSDRNYNKGVTYYMKYFKKVREEKIVIDMTPKYMTNEKYILRMKTVLSPDTKFIIILRDPIQRAISQYRMVEFKGKKVDTINSVFRQCLKKQENHFDNFIARGLYYEQIKMIEKHFKKENIYLIVFEEFIKDVQASMVKLSEFLAIDSTFVYNIDASKHDNKGLHINIFGKIFYSIPFQTRRKLKKKLPAKIEKHIHDMMLSKKKPLDDVVLEVDVVDQLTDLYAPQKERLEKEYGLNLKEWN